MRKKLLHLNCIKSRASDDILLSNQCINLYSFSVFIGSQDDGEIMMLFHDYMNLRRNDAADAFCKNIPVRRSCGRIYLVFSLDCWGLGNLDKSLMWTDEVGRWLFEISIISCSMPLSTFADTIDVGIT